MNTFRNYSVFFFPLTFVTLFLCKMSKDNLDSKDQKCIYILLAEGKKGPN